MTKKEITKVVEENPDISDLELSIQANCSIGYAYVIRKEYEEKKFREREKSERGEFYNAINMGKTFKAFIIADVHFPYHVNFVYDRAIEYGLAHSPDVVIILGDFVDFYKVSFWKSDPSRMPFLEEIAMCNQALKDLSNIFPDADKYYLEGNHEERIKNYLHTNSPEIARVRGLRLEEILDLEDSSWKFISSKEKMGRGEPPYSLGKLYMIHGHEKRISMAAVNHSKLFYDHCKVNLIAAHHHKSSEDFFKKMNFKIDGAFTVGCLCNLSPEYAPVNKWNWGLAMVYIDSDGDFSVQNRKIINGKVL